MQYIYTLIYQLSVQIKNRFGYAFTIKQAILLAFFGFLTGSYLALSALVKAAYLMFAAAVPLAAPVIYAMPSSTVVGAGVTAYISALAYQKAMRFVRGAWDAWVRTTHM